MSKTNLNCGLLIPVRNEVDLIPKLLSALLEFKEKNGSIINRVIFIDDHSQDKTKELILAVTKNESWITLVSNHNVISGYGSAISAGVKILKEENYDWVAIIDSDLSNTLENARELLQYCRNLDSNSHLVLIKANRFWGKKTHMTGVPSKRILFSITANLISRMFSFNVNPDPTNGFRAIHIPSYPIFVSSPGFDSILQEMYEIKMSGKEIGFLNNTLRADLALRQTTSFTYKTSTFIHYLKWSILIGWAQVKIKSKQLN
jgi:glycosyltransferase involved in cell wall biosynthesis